MRLRESLPRKYITIITMLKKKKKKKEKAKGKGYDEKGEKK